VGDVIRLDTAADSALPVQLEDRVRFLGQPGQIAGQLAERIVERVTDDTVVPQVERKGPGMSDTPPERSGATGSVSWQSFDRPEGTGETAAPGEQAGGEAASVHPAAFMALSQETQSGGPQSIEFLRDVEVELTA